MTGIVFSNPVYLWTLLLIPLMVYLHLITLNRVQNVALKFSNFEAIRKVTSGNFLGQPTKKFIKRKNFLLLLTRALIYVLLIFSISGISIWYTGQSSESDFVVDFDVSFSMLADDLSPNRLEAAKAAAITFLDSIPDNTNISIVTFSSTVFVEKGLDSDMELSMETVRKVTFRENSGTNIGDAIVTSTNILKNSDSKAIVLITDGQSNTGTPVSKAVEYAKANGVIIYPIGIGTKEGGKFLNTSLDLSLLSRLDEESLTKIASDTSGKYFKAYDAEKLKEAFSAIASSKEKIITINISWILLIISLCILAMDWILMYTVYKKIP